MEIFTSIICWRFPFSFRIIVARVAYNLRQTNKASVFISTLKRVSYTGGTKITSLPKLVHLDVKKLPITKKFVNSKHFVRLRKVDKTRETMWSIRWSVMSRDCGSGEKSNGLLPRIRGPDQTLTTEKTSTAMTRKTHSLLATTTTTSTSRLMIITSGLRGQKSNLTEQHSNDDPVMDLE